MNFREMLEGIRHHRYIDDNVKEKIINYLEGEITFEELALNNNHNCGRWYLDGFRNEINKAFEEGTVDKDLLKRVLKVYFTLIGKDSLGEIVQTIDFSKTLEIYESFYEEFIDKETLLYKVFSEEGSWNVEDGVSAIFDTFGMEDAINFLKNSNKLKKGGFYKYSQNPYVLVLLKDLTKTYEEKRYDEVKGKVLNILNALGDDYKCTDEYISRSNYEKKKGFRAKLEEESKKALLELIDTGNNWEKNIETFKSSLKPVGRREIFAFLEEDEEFISLFNRIKSMKKSREGFDFIDRFMKMLLEVVPNFYIEKFYFLKLRSSCAWKNPKFVLDELIKTIDQNKEIEEQLANYFIMYTVEHFACDYKTHNETFKLLIEHFGTEYIFNHLKLRSTSDKTLAIYLVDKYGDSELVKESKKTIEDFMLNNLFKSIAVDEEAQKELFAYVNKEKDKINIKKLLKKKIDDFTPYGKWSIFKGDKLERLVEVILESKNNSLFEFLSKYFYQGEEFNFPHKYILDLIIKLNINTKEYLKVFVGFISDNTDGADSVRFNGTNYDFNVLYKALEYLEENGINCLELGGKFSAKLKKTLVDSIYGKNKCKREVLCLVDFLGEKQKGLVESAFKNLLNLDESVTNLVEEKIYNELSSFTGDKEIRAVEVLCHYKTDEERIKNIYEEVKEPKSRDIISNVIGLEATDLYTDEKGEFDLDIYLDSVYKKSKKLPIDLDKIVKPVRIDGKDVDRALEQLFVSYKNSDELSINKEALLITKALTEESTYAFAKSVFLAWQQGPMDMKSKWQLLIPIIHGDFNLIKEIAILIEDLALNSRQKLAVYLIKALALNGTKDAFIAIDKIGRRTKFKTLRLASQEAFEIAAKELGISKGQLGDQLVGDMGLVDGYVSLSYGNQVVKLFIGADLKFEIEKEDGKRVKSLPKGTKDDNEDLVKKAAEEFKILKKQLKEMVTLQTNRMEDALVEHRLWTSKNWQELFLQNPIMNIIGKGLVWAVYKENKLEKTFAFDTELFDVDYENITLDEDNLIGIVHPLELSKEDIDNWKEVFSDNETTLLFDQLDREVLGVEDKESYEFKPKDYPRKSPNTLVSRLQKKGWSIGSVRDGGGFEEIYKEIRTLNIGIELTVNGSPGMGGYGYEAYDSDDGLVGVEKIEFYRLGKIQRGSYVYDELEKHNGLRYMPKELPERIVSELLLEVKKGLS